LKRALAILASAVMAVACGSTEAATQSPTPVAASPSPSSTPSPAGLVFLIKGINTSAAGTITLTQGTGTMTLEVRITGLAADSSHVSHIHRGSCQAQGGIIFALNQVVADGTGTADTRTTLQATYPPATGHWYVVVHAGPNMQGSNATYLLCGNLF
jgi:CHRD domain-containing protein